MVLFDLAARFKLRVLREVIGSAFLGLDADAALSGSSTGKASISVSVGVMVMGAAIGSVI